MPCLAKLNIATPLAIVLLLVASADGQTNISGSIFDGSGGPLLSGTVYHATAAINVPAGETLTVQAGAIVKFATTSGNLQVDGTLNVTASFSNPAIFTRIEDDTAGGDTNGDGGASAPAVGTWRGVRIEEVAGIGNVVGLELRYTGNFGNAAFRARGSGLNMSQCRVRDYINGAISMNNTGSPTVDNCVFENGDEPGKQVPIEALPGLTNNTAVNNSSNNSWLVTQATIDADISINANTVMGGAHIIKNGIAIAPAQTLTVNAGVNFKFNSTAQRVLVSGTLVCNGTAGAKVGFTVIEDDSLGGDTNVDGPSTGTPGRWRGINFAATDTDSMLTHTVIAYAGNVGLPAVQIVGTNPILLNCSVTDCAVDGISLENNLTPATFTNCNFDRNGRAVDGVLLENVPNFVNCTSANNTISNLIHVTNGTIGANTIIGSTNQVGGALELGSSVAVPANLSLTLNEGVILKARFTSNGITISGTLLINGTNANPVVYTTMLDDMFGGDSNLDGPSVGVPGTHRRLDFMQSAMGTVNCLIVRFGGNFGQSGIRVSLSSPTLTNCTVEDCSGTGLAVVDGTPTVTNCNFDRCNIPITMLNMESLANFSANTATGNVQFDAIRNTDVSLAQNLSLTTDNLLGSVLVNTGSTNILAGSNLTLGPGVIFKYVNTSNSVQVSGSLDCQGTLANPVILTRIEDDTADGDTNKDGSASVPIPGQWRGVSFNAGSGPSNLAQTRIRYAGNLGLAGVTIATDSVTLSDCVIEECLASAVSFNALDIAPSIRDCSFNNCSRSLDNMRLANFKNLRDNTAFGNTLSDSPRLTNGVAGVDDVLFKRSLINNVLISTATLSVTTGQSLRIESGCIIKFVNSSNSIVANDGNLEILGTGIDPVILTVQSDDVFGGDSNLDGASVGAPLSWRGVRVAGPMVTGRVEFVRVRFAGNLSIPAFFGDAPGVIMRAIRVEHSGNQAFDLTAASGDIDNLVAFDCVNGIKIGATAVFRLRHATVTACTGTGIDANATYTGLIQNTISWGNGTNFVGTTVANLFASNGDAALTGINGNMDADPLFLDASLAVGSLFLTPASPSVGTADFFVSLFVGSDHVESTRIADLDLDGLALSDMGAYESAPYFMVKSGEPVGGETMFFAMLGPPGIGFLYLGLLNGVPQYFHPYGMFLTGDANNIFFELMIDQGFGYPITFPVEPAIVGVRFGVQCVGAPLGMLSVGSFTNMYRGIIQD